MWATSRYPTWDPRWLIISSICWTKTWKGGTTHCHLGKSPWLPGNNNRSFNNREGGHPNGRRCQEGLWRGKGKHDRHGNTPVKEHLFDFSDSPQPLDKNKNQYLHTMTANLIFLSKRARPYILEAVDFITTIVKGPDIDGYKNIGRFVKYLRGGGINDPHTKGWQCTCHIMVGWRIVCCALRHLESHRSHYVSSQGLNILNINKKKAK